MRITNYPNMHSAQARDFERRLLSAGFWYPIELHNAAVRAGLTGADFAFSDHRWLFATLCTAADRGFRLTYDELRELNQQAGDPFMLSFNEHELAELVEEDVLPVDIGRWVQAVKELANRRRRAAQLRRDAQDLIAEPLVPGGASSKRKAAVVNRRRGGRCVSAR